MKVQRDLHIGYYLQFAVCQLVISRERSVKLECLVIGF